MLSFARKVLQDKAARLVLRCPSLTAVVVATEVAAAYTLTLVILQTWRQSTEQYKLPDAATTTIRVDSTFARPKGGLFSQQEPAAVRCQQEMQQEFGCNSKTYANAH